MHFTPWPFWFRIVSMATVVLPVLRSPMMSSRWPRPMGVIASIALMPVCSGSETGWRPVMPGAWISMRRVVGVDQRTLAVDRLAERVHDATEQRVADGHDQDATGRANDLLLFDACRPSPRTTAPIVSSSRFIARPTRAVFELEELVDLGRRAGPTRARCRRRPRPRDRPARRRRPG